MSTPACWIFTIAQPACFSCIENQFESIAYPASSFGFAGPDGFENFENMLGGDLVCSEVADNGGGISRQCIRPLLSMFYVFPAGTMGL